MFGQKESPASSFSGFLYLAFHKSYWLTFRITEAQREFGSGPSYQAPQEVTRVLALETEDLGSCPCSAAGFLNWSLSLSDHQSLL